jgi:hypothetical protein
VKGDRTTQVLSQAMTIEESEFEAVRKELIAYAEPLCHTAEETALPPLRAINHRIPLIDEKKIYPWRASRCPLPLRSQWDEKKKAYIKSGRWRTTQPKSREVPSIISM